MKIEKCADLWVYSSMNALGLGGKLLKLLDSLVIGLTPRHEHTTVLHRRSTPQFYIVLLYLITLCLHVPHTSSCIV